MTLTGEEDMKNKRMIFLPLLLAAFLTACGEPEARSSIAEDMAAAETSVLSPETGEFDNTELYKVGEYWG